MEPNFYFISLTHGKKLPLIRSLVHNSTEINNNKNKINVLLTVAAIFLRAERWLHNIEVEINFRELMNRKIS